MTRQNEAVNTRDIGGIPLDGGYQTACKKVYKGGYLANLTSAGCDEFKALGVKTIIDVREQDEVTKTPNAGCVTTKQVVAPLSKLLPDNPENYKAILNDSVGIKVVFDVLGDKGSYPVFIHCIIGRDRAAQATALALLALGANKQSIVDEFMLSAQAPNIDITPQKASMEAFVDEVEKRGGIESFLKSTGVTDAQIDALREVMRIKQ